MERLYQYLVMRKIYGVEMEQCNLHMNNVIQKIKVRVDGELEHGKNVIVHVN
jgi:hypothetical protein